jgi:Flp pilus assembly pilin Flp
MASTTPSSRMVSGMCAETNAFWQDEDGLTNVEYALLLGLICIGCLVMWGALGGRVNSTVGQVGSTVAAPP